MPSDGRYLYNQAGMQNTNYDYSAYPPPPPSSYDNSQLAQPQSRPMRPAPTSQPQSPHQPYNPPPPTYPPSYGPGPYMTHPPQHSQWSGDNWAHYNQNYAHPPQPQPQPPPPPPPSEGPYNPVPGRPEAVPSSSAEPRGYGTSNQPDPRRIEERQPPPPISNPPPQPTARRREHESPPAASPGTPTGLDFMKLLESYRIILEANNSSGPGRPPPAETFERMVQSATYGAQMLESATFQQKTPPSEVTRSPMRKEPEEGIEAPDATVATAPKPQKQEEGPAQEGQSCKGCNATSTPEWRRGPLGPRTLCNACGLVYAKLLKKRVREGGGGPSNGAEAGSHGALDDSGEGESDDDDDEYGSQDRRSEGGRE